MNDIQVGRFSGILHKLLGITEGSPAPTLAPEIFPMIVLESERPEWAFLGGERLCQGATLVGAGGAGVYSMAGVSNPDGSGTLVVIDQITVLPPSATAIIFTRMVTNAAVATATGQDANQRDSRLYGLGTAGQLFFDGLAVVPGVQLDYWKCPNNPATTRDVEYVLSPGFAIFVYNTTANVGLDASFRWRERVLEPSEAR